MGLTKSVEQSLDLLTKLSRRVTRLENPDG